MIFLSLGTVTQIQAQTTPTGFSGQAVGLIANANVVGGTAVVDSRVADTDPRTANATSSFNITRTVSSATIDLNSPSLARNRITTDLITTNTSGGPNNGSTSQSSATVNNLSVRLLDFPINTGLNLTADTVQSTSFCRCTTNNGPRCTGTTTIENLRFRGVIVPIVDANGNATVNPAPNTRISLLGGTVILVLNEQIVTTTDNGNRQEITVNALHIIVNIPGVATADIIVSQSTSDISCPAGTTAAPVSISGRVISPFGRGLAGARIVLTNSIGERRMAVTNPFGYFSFKEIGSGETYIVEITHKSYYFTSQVLSVTNDLTELNFTALPFGKSDGKSRSIPAN